jgi:uncharacterized protein (TIRG00374 family)
MKALSPRSLISIGVSFLILGVIYWKIDIANIKDVLVQVDGSVFMGALLILIPTTLLSAFRFRMLLRGQNKPSLGLATKLILAGSTMNVVLPSKMGDMLKSVFMRDALDMRGSLAVSVVVFEKACDLLGLLAWCLLGLVVYAGDDALFIFLVLAIGGGLGFGILMLSSLSFADWFFRLVSKVAPSSMSDKFENLCKSWAEVHGFFWRSKRAVLSIVGVTLLIWFLHMLQIWLLATALHAPVPLLSSLGLSSLALLAGLAPLTLAGVGTRDAAAIYLFAPFMAAPAGAALGLMLTLRYVLPGLAGLPFLAEYIDVLRKQRKRDLAKSTEGE